MRGRMALMAVVVAFASATLACGGGTSVGEDIAVDASPGATGPRLGEREATPSPKKTATPDNATPAPSAAAAKTAAPAQAPAVVIKIQSDTAPGGSQFDPRLAQVRRGSIVRWQNTDTVARSVEADGGAFRSPKIAPGGRFDYTADTPGSFNYHDGTRPYAVGSLEVA